MHAHTHSQNPPGTTSLMCFLLSPVPWPWCGPPRSLLSSLVTWLSRHSLPQCLSRPVSPAYDSTSVSLEDPQPNHTNQVSPILISNPITLSAIQPTRTLGSDLSGTLSQELPRTPPTSSLSPPGAQLPTLHWPAVTAPPESLPESPWTRWKTPAMSTHRPRSEPVASCPICLFAHHCFPYSQCVTQSRYSLDKNVFNEWMDPGRVDHWRSKHWTQRQTNDHRSQAPVL